MAASARSVGRAADVAGLDDVLRCRLLRVKGGLLMWSADYAGAWGPLQAALDLAKGTGDRHEEGLTLFALGLWVGFSGTGDDGSEARATGRRYFARCLELFGQEGDRYHEARSLMNLAVVVDDVRRREALLRDAIEAFRSCNGFFGLTLALHNLAQTRRHVDGAYDDARVLFDEAVEVERSQGIHARHAWWLAGRADVLVDSGRLDEAERDREEIEAMTPSLGAGFGAWEIEHAGVIRGRLQLERGWPDLAAATFRRVARWESGAPDPFGYRLRAMCWEAVAQWQAERWESGERLALAVLRVPEWRRNPFAFPLRPYNALVDSLVVEARVRRGDVAAALETLVDALGTVKPFRLLPSALRLCLATARLAAFTGSADEAGRLLTLAARHPAATAFTRAEARRRLAASEGCGHAGVGIEAGDEPGGARAAADAPPSFDVVWDTLEAVTVRLAAALAAASEG